MPKYQSKPLTVEAVRYEAPDTGGGAGNLSDLQALAGDVLQRQAPWNPADGQNCLLLVAPAEPVAHDVDGNPTAYSEAVCAVLKPGDYLIRAGDGSLAVADGERFEAAWTAVEVAEPTANAAQATADDSARHSA